MSKLKGWWTVPPEVLKVNKEWLLLQKFVCRYLLPALGLQSFLLLSGLSPLPLFFYPPLVLLIGFLDHVLETGLQFASTSAGWVQIQSVSRLCYLRTVLINI